MLIKEAIRLAEKELKASSLTPMLDAKVLMCGALSISPEQLILSLNDQLEIYEKYFKLIDRRKKFEPIAYILCRQEFYGLNFYVNPHVLIPRPETEMIIDQALQLLQKMPKANILDLGAGSGIIPICLAKNLTKEYNITAVDISLNALKVAHENAEIHDVRGNINLLQSDWFENILPQKFDLIISNPPYIAESEISEVAKSTHKFEPHLALYASQNGLSNYQIIAEKASSYLNKNGKILLEIGYLQAKDVSNIFAENGFQNIEVIKDYAGLDRNLLISFQNI